MCENCKKTYYLTTAIAYTSGKPHIGNCYEAVLADSIVRFKRLEGYDVRFQTGTDEHGQKIEQKAEEKGVTPKEFVDDVSGQIKAMWDLLNISYDRFIRTTDADHERQVQKIFKKLYDQGDIYKGYYEGMYCTPCESFFTPSQLVDGKCPDCGRPCQPAKEEAYFLKLSKYTDRLIEHINTHPEFIQPESRKNEMMNNFLLPGLQDLCVSRTSFKWGVPVDFDDKHVVYVWVDALSNYITGLGYDVDGDNGPLFEKYWPADLHLIGKDILRFHTIYWPIMLMALDLPLPKQIFGHPWLLRGAEPWLSQAADDGKMSKSKGNVIYADDLASIFGVDAVRYYVLHEMPFDNDGVITWDLMTERTNSDLANTLGNLVKRTISMTNKYFGGVVENTGELELNPARLAERDGAITTACGENPTEEADVINGNPADAAGAAKAESADNGAASTGDSVTAEITYPDEELIDLTISTLDIVQADMDELRVADALTDIFALFKRCNKYIDETAPWVLAKDPEKEDRLKQVLYNLTGSIRVGATLLAPFMPETSEKILQQLNTTAMTPDEMKEWPNYPSGNKVTDSPEILFQRMDPKKVQEQVKALLA
ncbi:MAG: methionine--tRNA ligase [Lachnospiraceae bacterium]|nr:methionine--tRNA ligase [Lachnospiraceae bacterium]